MYLTEEEAQSQSLIDQVSVSSSVTYSWLIEIEKRLNPLLIRSLFPPFSIVIQTTI
jgi:hypothetical protein